MNEVVIDARPSEVARQVFCLGAFDYDDMPSDSSSSSSSSNSSSSPERKRMRSEKNVLWRLDPIESFSDWTIIVTLEDGSDGNSTMEETYHVHKNYLGAGANRSEYFHALFRTKNQVEELLTSVSKIRLQRSAAAAMKEMLDFVYTGDCHICTENAVALRFLAHYFGIPTLHSALKKFIKQDLFHAVTGESYLTEARAYHDKKMIDQVFSMYARLFKWLSSSQINSLSAEDLITIVSSNEFNCESTRYSIMLSERLRQRPEEIQSLEKLLILTRDEIMPNICPSVSLFFLNLASNHEGERCASLRQRCLESSGQCIWKTFKSDPNPQKNSALSIDDFSQSKEFQALTSAEKVDTLQWSLIGCSESLIQLHSHIKSLEIERGALARRISSALNNAHSYADSDDDVSSSYSY